MKEDNESLELNVSENRAKEVLNKINLNLSSVIVRSKKHTDSDNRATLRECINDSITLLDSIFNHTDKYISFITQLQEYRDSLETIPISNISLGNELINNLYDKIRTLIQNIEFLSIKQSSNWLGYFAMTEKNVINPLRILEQKNYTESNKKVFIVHGHDNGFKEEVARFVQKLGLDVIILHEQANKGKTLIQKFKDNSDVGFAIVLLSPDDVGNDKENKDNLKPRARQNVILELGYFIGKLEPERVCALVKGTVEEPSDFDGVVYVKYDGNDWKNEIAREIKASGIEVNLNALIK